MEYLNYKGILNRITVYIMSVSVPENLDSQLSIFIDELATAYNMLKREHVSVSQISGDL